VLESVNSVHLPPQNSPRIRAVDSPATKLNPLLRLAALSGVETAIRLHIRRGDDLNARDAAGATPLILAAAKRRSAVVRLLLAAGANPKLTDLRGMDALAHAVRGGCSNTIALLAEALARGSASDLSGKCLGEGAEVTREACGGVLSVHQPVEPLAQPIKKPLIDVVPSSGEILLPEALPEDGIDENVQPPVDQDFPRPVPTDPEVAPEVVLTTAEEVFSSLDEGELSDVFAGDWEAEDELSVPEGDETVAEAARRVHEAIGRHKAVDRDEDWEGVDLHLPDRAAPLARNEGDGAVRALLLAALREGMVSETDLIDVCCSADGTRNESDERLLGIVVGELGASIVEWTGSEVAFLAQPSVEEDRLLTEAAEFAEDLASGRNDPFRFYSKDIRADLLEAEEEIALAREMEEAGRAALSALAGWPQGLSALSDAASRVVAGEADAESFSAGPEPSSEEEPVSRAFHVGNYEHDESGPDELVSFFLNAVATVEAVCGDAGRVTEALEEARLTRGFLMELAEKAGQDQAGLTFAEAIGRQVAARERMILCNLRLALAIAKKYLWSGVPFDDLVQEANIGLMKAVERYEWRKGFRFSTYATWWIRQQVSRSIANTGRAVRAPVHVQEAARKLRREREVAETQLGRPETASETARRTGMPFAKIQLLLAMFDDVISLDEVDGDTGLARSDCLVDEKSSEPATVAESACLRSTLLEMLADLDERGRQVILFRFGLHDDALTLEEIGQQFGVTRERIRQIESKSMKKLSHCNKRQILWPFMGERYAPRQEPSSGRT
jgi:RNA polymerase primary sigma factor